MKLALRTLTVAAALAAVACNDKPSPQSSAALTAPATPAADNTRVNARDDAGLPTPMDQGNDDRDLRITQAIRKAVMSDDSLSSNAKNCKIISDGGKVVLRGPVANARERMSVEAKAHAVPEVASVDDELEVKMN